MSELLRRLAYYFRRRRFEEDLDEEMRYHAALAGSAQFGNLSKWKEESRAMWTGTFWEQLAQDLRYAIRAMNNSRAFTALAVLSLALGIGANTAIFSFMDAILLRSLPVKDPESLMLLKWHTERREMHGISIHHSDYSSPDEGFISGVFSYPAFELFRKQDAIFSSVFAYQSVSGLTVNVTIKGQAGLGNGEYVSGDYFDGLGMPPAAGRLIAPDDDRAGASAVAAVSFGFSEQRFGGPANAVGQPVLIDNVPFTVIGVAPPEFFGTDPGAAPEIYLPLHSNLLLEANSGLPPAPRYLDPNFNWIEVMARLRPGVGLTQAQAVLAPPFRQLVESAATADSRWRQVPSLVVKPGAGGIQGLRQEYSKPLYLLMTLVGLILAIACANIANLLLARAASRKRELAVRLSMGAGRFRVIRQLLTESVLLASMGGVLGVGLAIWGMRFLTLLLANGRENFTLHANLNGHVLTVAAGLSLVTGVLFGLAPALQSTRVDLAPALKATKQAQSRRLALGQLLIVSQIAIALLLVVAAGLFVRTLSNLESINLGFNRQNVLTFQLNARQAGHKEPEIISFYGDLQKRFSAIPGVQSASLSYLPLIGMGTSGTRVAASGAEPKGTTRILPVGPGFFSTMQIPILRGREIGESDRTDSQMVGVVNQEFARKNFGDGNPLGQHLSMPRLCEKCDIEIVGVSANARYGGLTGNFALGER